MQKVGLILGKVLCFIQKECTTGFFDTCIVSRCDLVAAQMLGVGQKFLEFDFPVAQYVRVRCAPGSVFAQKNGKDPLPVFMREVNGPQGYIQCITDLSCHGKVFACRAVHLIIVLFPVLHEQGRDIPAVPFKM